MDKWLGVCSVMSDGLHANLLSCLVGCCFSIYCIATLLISFSFDFIVNFIKVSCILISVSC